jgi:ABC-type Fe3+ transport system permease subunit
LIAGAKRTAPNARDEGFRFLHSLLWVFLVPLLSPLKSTVVSIWLAYAIVWLAYGMRLVSGTLLQVAPELEEAARTAGANDLRVKRDVTAPLNAGELASDLPDFRA